MRLLAGLVASGSVLLMASCSGIDSPSGNSSAATTPCSPQAVRQTVERFTDAFNRGDLSQLDQLVSKQFFNWYSTNGPGERLNAAAHDRTTLMAYFAWRHRQHERLAVEFVDVQFTSADRAGFTFRLMRSAEDGLPPTPYNGKGELECSIRPISVGVWSMAPADWWPPYELLPEIGLIALLGAGLVGFLSWRRKTRSGEPATTV